MRRAGRLALVAAVALAALASAAGAGAAGERSLPLRALHRVAKLSGDPPAATKHDVSPPLADLAPAAAPKGKKKKGPKEVGVPPVPSAGASDPVVQSTAGTGAAPALGLGFEGVGLGFTGPQGTFSPDAAPPDTNGAVGPNDYVQLVNESFAIFNKSGTVLYGPVPTNTLWSGFGGGCQTNDDGDGTVVYDQLADRWIFTQFSVSTKPYLECVAVSTSGDPTGSYYRYSFQYSNFPDYPKLGVWPDAYYITFNMFGSVTFAGPEMCAYDRAKMLAGQAATQKCFTLGTNDISLLPATVDGPTPPPAGAPNYMLEYGTNDLLLWKFHVDWTTPTNSTFTGPTTIPVASFSPACGGDTCIPQPGTTTLLDSLADRLMYRLVYRNFGDHESLVVDHSVTAGSSTGIRWYELRNPGGTPTVYQQGTYAPDSSYRWMGSAAMDGKGDVAIGYSVSSKTLSPSIRYTAHLAGTDALGVMGQGEGTLFAGTGSQTSTLTRWGDYSSLNVDPSDDCTFWYTSEYLAATGSFNWHTRIGTFTLPGCTSDFSLSASAVTGTVTQGDPASYSITVTPSGGFSSSVALSVSGLPAGATGTFTPSSTTSASTLSVTTSGTTPAGTYPLTITGTGGGLTHTTPATLIVQAPPPDFSLSVTPAADAVVRGDTVSYAVAINPLNAFAGAVALSVSGLPAGASATFLPSTATASSTLLVSTSRTSPKGSQTLTITGVSGLLTRSTTVTLLVR